MKGLATLDLAKKSFLKDNKKRFFFFCEISPWVRLLQLKGSNYHCIQDQRNMGIAKTLLSTSLPPYSIYPYEKRQDRTFTTVIHTVLVEQKKKKTVF